MHYSPPANGSQGVLPDGIELSDEDIYDAMRLTKTLHPPGGATALIAVIGSDRVHDLGFLYALVPAGLGAVIPLVVALLVNNIPDTRRYPEIWF